jgi:S-DNA-T family DNA segregation ATPase FtsK/SpoIIIE
VVVLDGASALRGLPDLAEVLQCGPSVGICVIALDADPEELPSEASAVLDLAGPGRPRLHLPGSAATDVVVDRVGAWWADRLSRGLAPLRVATPGEAGSALPQSVDLLDLLQSAGGGGVGGSLPGSAGDGPQGGPSGLEGSPSGLDGAVVVRAWSEAAHRSRVPVGVTVDGPFTIDLADDGPHLLVAGTTGAGKSELLRTLVASLAVHNRPEHLSLVLIDYKGGAAFRECHALPHVAGVVTDLDDHLADRALTSLTAELTRRERLFAEAGVTDFLSYQSSSASQRAPVPRLVVVIDEFRALAEELPQLIDGMVRVAALGRSLGVHLVLATQRPAGVVTAEIKANVNLRIALRVRDRMDSDDVIEAPDAAGLDGTVPGRGYARCGGAPLVRFQAAYAGGRSRAADPRGIRARRVDWDRPATPWPHPATDPGRVTDLGAVVAAVCEAAATVDAQPAPAPWLAALPPRFTADSLPRGATAFAIPIGLADEPAAQRQRPLEVDLAAPGHWGLVGAPGSGRSTALMTVSCTAASMLDATRLHLYAVSGGSLARLSRLPHCGAHVGWDDLARLDRLVTRLTTEVADRRQRLAASRHATIADWWRAGDAETPPALLVVVDDWDVLAQRTDDVTHGTLVERLLAVLREGAGAGLTGVVAGDRGLLVGRAAPVLALRVLLRLTDRTDAILAGVAPTAIPRVQPPGRGVLLDGTEVQLALPPPLPTAPGDVAGPPDSGVPTTLTGLADPAGPGTPRPRSRPWRVDELPGMVDVGHLPTPEDRDDVVYLGVGGDELSPLGLSPGRHGRRWIISGGNGSGVSTSLVLVVADALRRGKRVAVVARGRGPWGPLRQDPRLLWCDDPAEPGDLIALSRQVPELDVVVDDADELLDSPAESALTQVATLVDRDGGLLAVGASAAALSNRYRGLPVELARHRTGVLLGPTSPGEADVFGLRVPVDPGAVAGRGYLVRGAVATALQVARWSPDESR